VEAKVRKVRLSSENRVRVKKKRKGSKKSPEGGFKEENVVVLSGRRGI
jgi:hypothetical protein